MRRGPDLLVLGKRKLSMAMKTAPHYWKIMQQEVGEVFSKFVISILKPSEHIIAKEINICHTIIIEYIFLLL